MTGNVPVRDSWRLAVGTLTALPVLPPTSVDRRVARGAVLLAPLAVLPLGLVVAAIGVVGRLTGLPALVIGLLAVGALALGTRALHVDGLSDTIDGLSASYDRERALKVMKSGTSGPAGVLATMLVVGLQASALGVLLSNPRSGLVAGLVVCLSRAALAVTCARGLPPARTDGLGQPLSQVVPVPVAVLVGIVAAGLLTAAAGWAGALWWAGAASTALTVVVLLVLVRHVHRRLGGLTGDVYGAAIEIGAASLLVGLLAFW